MSLVETLRRIVGSDHVLTDPGLRARYETDWTGRFHGESVAVVRPDGTPQVAAVLEAARSASVGVVPQGGNTGLVGGGVPRGGEIVLSLERLDALEPVEVMSASVVVGAGAVLANVQQAARAHGLDTGVDLAARDSATIGGMVATNAGGLHVIRWGPMRDHVLGVEAVRSDGAVIGRVPGLRKDNSGYSIPSLLAGSEGTLAVITRVHLRLVPLMTDRVVALVGFASIEALTEMCAQLRRSIGSLHALEFFLDHAMHLVCDHTGMPRPFPNDANAYLLVECAGTAGAQDRLVDSLAGVLGDHEPVAVAIEPGPIGELWSYRERITETISSLGVPHKLDVTVPEARASEFVRAVRDEIAAIDTNAEPVLFGHLGDGNVHVNVLGLAPDDERVDAAVFALAARFGGSISAEHGIGVAKAKYLHLTRTSADLATLAAVRRAFDPAAVLNPGVLAAEGDVPTLS